MFVVRRRRRNEREERLIESIVFEAILFLGYRDFLSYKKKEEDRRK
jgi:hypothetical protein